MKALSNNLVIALAGIATSALGFAATGCSSSNSGNGDGAGGSGATACTSNDLSVAYATMYSAYIEGGSHTFQIPAVVSSGVSNAGVKWSVSDPKLATTDNTGNGVLITTMGAGDVTITANLNGACGSAVLHITAATEDQWAAGNSRYNNNNPLPMVPTDANGNPMLPPGGFVVDPPDHPPACTNCHGDTATSNFFKTISHTPEQTGGFSDTELIGIFTNANLPSMGYFDETIIPKRFWSYFHKWSDIQGDAQEGMVVYLRSLTPKSQGGSVDFGGFMRPGGGTGGSTATGAVAGGSPGVSTGGGGAAGAGN